MTWPIQDRHDVETDGMAMMARCAELLLPGSVPTGTAAEGSSLTHWSRALRPRWLVAAAATTAVALVVLWPRQDAGYARAEGQPSGRPQPPGASVNEEARTPPAFPETKLGVGLLALDQPVEQALATLGSPASTEPDINATTAHVWDLDAGARLTVGAWDDTGEISGLFASVLPGSRARIGVFGGVIVGESRPRDVVAAWGGAFTIATSPVDDFVVSYVECVGPFPVVIKFDQPAAGEEPFTPTARSPLWDEPVTGVLVAYADEPPGSAGCPPSRS